MYVSAGVCGHAVYAVCVCVCVPFEASVCMFIWCVFTLSWAVSVWVYGRWLLWWVVCVCVCEQGVFYVSLLKGVCVQRFVCVRVQCVSLGVICSCVCVCVCGGDACGQCICQDEGLKTMCVLEGGPQRELMGVVCEHRVV